MSAVFSTKFYFPNIVDKIRPLYDRYRAINQHIFSQ